MQPDPRKNLPLRASRPTLRSALAGLPAVLLLLLAFGGPVLGWPAAALLVLGGLGVGGVATLWGLANLRSVRYGLGAAVRWAFWLTPLFCLALISTQERFLAQAAPMLGSLSLRLSGSQPAVVFFLCLSLFPILFLTGTLAAAVGALAGRKEGPAASAPVGVGTWWVLLFLCLGPLKLALGDPPHPAIVLPLALPLLTYWTCGLLGRLKRTKRPLLERGVGAVSRGLVLRWRSGGRPHRLDLRGTALGLAAAAVALALSGAGLLAPLQASILVSTMVAGRSWARLALPQNGGPTEIVLLEMDAPYRHEATTRTSEAAVQARVLERLGAWGVLRAVVPLPLVEHPPSAGEAPAPPSADPGRRRVRERRVEGMSSDLPQDAPGMTLEAADASLRDLPLLERAMRACGNVVLVPWAPTFGGADGAADLALRPAERSRGAFDRLKPAAGEVGLADLPSYETLRLVALPVGQTGGYPPAPLTLHAARAGQPLRVAPVTGARLAVALNGAVFPLFAPGIVLVDFSGPGEAEPYHRLTYSNVLRGEPVLVTEGAGPTGRWVHPREYLRGKIVILDSLSQAQRATPLGPMLWSEALAYATDGLLDGRAVGGVDPAAGAAITLLLGALVGGLCAGRSPLEGGWRVALAGFAVVFLSFFTFLSTRLWLDPMVPLTAGIGGYLLVSQFNLALASQERERNRALLARFVAPRVVEELLEDPEGGLGLGGARQKVCVLFADMRGFTGYAERHSPEEVVETTNAYMTAMTDALFAHEGILDKYLGDGLMALFRITGDPEAGIERALQAALSMRDAAETVAARIAAEGGEPLRVGFGMHYGEAVLGLVGSPTQFNYTALGHVVVVAQRLQTLAAGGEIVVSESVYLAVSGKFPLDEGEPLSVKGLSRPVVPYRLAPSPAAEHADTLLLPDSVPSQPSRVDSP